jgi:hypothetical protein
MDIKNIQSVASVLGTQCARSDNTVKSENKSHRIDSKSVSNSTNTWQPH